MYEIVPRNGSECLIEISERGIGLPARATTARAPSVAERALKMALWVG